jgi:serine/threonine protein kinase
MGEVYRAQDSRLGRTVAVKILPPEAATPARLRQFEREARAASALNHPNILTIHDVGREGDIAYVAMEWIQGRSLREVLNGPRLPVRRIVELAVQIADGLAKAHAAGIVHRDIKPENVMISDDGFAKVVDFGLATLSAEASDEPNAPVADRTRTVTGLAGTVGYMSPEQASGHPVDHRSDQFALGVMLYEMATRIRPIERATTAQSLVATIEAEPPPVEVVNRDVPPALATIIGRCLAKAPRHRYESTRDLARDLRGAVDLHAGGGTPHDDIPTHCRECRGRAVLEPVPRRRGQHRRFDYQPGGATHGHAVHLLGAHG